MRRMAIWTPPREMAQLAEDVNRLVSQVVGTAAGRESVRGSWAPPVDVTETADAIELDVELPGFAAGQVDVSLDNSVLSIRGERVAPEEQDGVTVHRLERTYGEFERTFQVPNTVDPSAVEARFSNGVLHITLPKREETKPRSIKVAVK